MKMTKTIAAFASAALLAAAVGLTGCTSEQESSSAGSSSSFSTESTIAEIQIPVKVTSPAAGEQVTFDETITIGEGATVLDALQATGLELDAQSSEYGMFVNAIDGLAGEGMTGWTYTVNGEQVQVSADQTYLEDGDVVEWSYIDMSE